ncbi:AcrR family transcriptional regulator [Inquilinus ginsengisoli]|uniref:TetR/AcrR family transcriptional regulator n=1 Tax=Inquilinus ginsengisoli TaxID=363840 RepID=UPI003D25BE4A
MARPKKFDRNSLLDKAIPLFWRSGYVGTNLHELERATGVNKSGLYSEFENKDDLFVSALKRYFDTRPGLAMLQRPPLGWGNVETFLRTLPFNTPGCAGCLSVNSTREVADLPERAVSLIRDFNAAQRAALAGNVAEEGPAMPVDAVCDLIATFFAGACIEANLGADRNTHEARVTRFMELLRKL